MGSVFAFPSKYIYPFSMAICTITIELPVSLSQSQTAGPFRNLYTCAFINIFRIYPNLSLFA